MGAKVESVENSRIRIIIVYVITRLSEQRPKCDLVQMSHSMLPALLSVNVYTIDLKKVACFTHVNLIGGESERMSGRLSRVEEMRIVRERNRFEARLHWSIVSCSSRCRFPSYAFFGDCG